MLFNSLVFLIFAAVFFALWPVLRGARNLRWGFITLASFFFYGWWDWRYLFLLLGSGLLDYGAALGMARFPTWRREFLWVSIVGNIGSLALFKYSGFFAENLDAVLGQFGSQWQLRPLVPAFFLTVPVGISFYTFQSMSYTIDVYRGQLQPTRNPLHFFAYLSLFPQLVAGPILRASELLPQLGEDHRANEAMRYEGGKLLLHGFFKKVVIADNLAPAVSAAFSMNVLSGGAGYWWLVLSMFAFQIYCDFSGYSDIARGLGKFMGLEMGVNFRHPYVSTSLREFWTRWHISLSTWFRDYVYIPLGGSRAGPSRLMVNLWITMLLSGLWHGHEWTFVIWGGIHAFFLSVERVTKWPERLKARAWGRYPAWAVIMLQVWLGWVFFRAESLSQAWDILGRMFDFSDTGRAPTIGRTAVIVLALAMARELYFFLRLDQRPWAQTPWKLRLDPYMLGLVMTACVFARGPGSEFIYFQF